MILATWVKKTRAYTYMPINHKKNINTLATMRELNEIHAMHR